MASNARMHKHDQALVKYGQVLVKHGQVLVRYGQIMENPLKMAPWPIFGGLGGVQGPPRGPKFSLKKLDDNLIVRSNIHCTVPLGPLGPTF